MIDLNENKKAILRAIIAELRKLIKQIKGRLAGIMHICIGYVFNVENTGRNGRNRQAPENLST